MFLKIDKFVNAFIDFLYPPYCIFCDSDLTDGRLLLCDRCWDSIPRFPQNEKIILELREKLGDDLMLMDAFTPWTFNEKIQYIIHQLKYNHHRKISESIGIRLAQFLRDVYIFNNIDIIIPVPLHHSRQRKRGYNQSELIGRAMAGTLNIPLHSDCLKRSRNTKSQTKLNIHQRLENVSNAFVVTNVDEIHGKSILLIDDVITTGSTINACAAQLIRHGAEHVYAAAAAKA